MKIARTHAHTHLRMYIHIQTVSQYVELTAKMDSELEEKKKKKNS